MHQPAAPPAPPTPPAPRTGPGSSRGPARPSWNLRRDPDDRIVAGVCAGLARQAGVDPIVVRVAAVAFALAGGVGVVLYLAAWSLSAPAGPEPRTPTRITNRRTLAVALVALGLLLLLRDLGLWFGDAIVVPVVLAAVGSAVLWARSDEDDRMRWSAVRTRLPANGHDLRRSPARVVVGLILIAVGMTAALAASNAMLALRSVGLGVGATIAGVGLVLGPWVARLLRDLDGERRERIRNEERAEVAAHLHDSVLQTLTLIQRSAGDPRRMVALARSQERELRAWLYGRRDAEDATATLRGLLDATLAAVEADHELDVELVVVGDAAPDEELRALLAAVREALHNAGAHSGATTASLYVEAGPDEVVAFVRDRGVGFDPDAVSDDRRGVADSIRGRLRRHGGEAVLRTAPGDGTEWELTVPRRTGDPDASPSAPPQTTPPPGSPT